MTLGERLKKLRLENNITQDDVAKSVNISRSNINNIENNANYPSVDLLSKLASFYNVSLDYLLGKTEIKNEEELRNIKFANNGGLDVSELTPEEVLELQNLVDLMRKSKNRLENKKKDNNN